MGPRGAVGLSVWGQGCTPQALGSGQEVTALHGSVLTWPHSPTVGGCVTFPVRVSRTGRCHAWHQCERHRLPVLPLTRHQNGAMEQAGELKPLLRVLTLPCGCTPGAEDRLLPAAPSAPFVPRSMAVRYSSQNDFLGRACAANKPEQAVPPASHTAVHCSPCTRAVLCAICKQLFDFLPGNRWNY